MKHTPLDRVSVSASEGRIEEEVAAVVTLSGDQWELNVWLNAAEIKELPNARDARWDNRTSLTLGRSSGIPVHWSCEGGALAVLVGHDDEAWQFCAMLPEEQLDEICLAAEDVIDQRNDS